MVKIGSAVNEDDRLSLSDFAVKERRLFDRGITFTRNGLKISAHATNPGVAPRLYKPIIVRKRARYGHAL